MFSIGFYSVESGIEFRQKQANSFTILIYLQKLKTNLGLTNK